ncbi:MAG: hypothetical protein ACRCZF_20465, partial [Gemmataceae bacterium]
MTPIPIPSTDATLRLTLPFAGYAPATRAILILVLFFAFLLAILLLYRAEMRLIARRFAILLLGLRSVLVASVFLLLGLDPIIARSQQEDVPGRVLIAVDRSDSMRVADPNRPLAEKLALAKILHLGHEIATEAQIDSWLRQARGSNQVNFSVFSGEDERSRYAKLIQKLDATPRLTIASRILTTEQLKFLETLQSKHTVELVGFGQEIAPLPGDRAKLSSLLEPPAGTPPPAPVPYTDLKPPLAQATETAGDDKSAKLLGVILLTDGRHNWGDPPQLKARELAERSVPIYPIVLAPKDPPADVAVLSAQAQAATVFKGSVVPIEANIRVAGWPAGPIKVTLDRPNAPDGSPRAPLIDVIQHNGKDATYPFAFKLTMDSPGPQTVSIKVDAGPNDRFPE